MKRYLLLFVLISVSCDSLLLKEEEFPVSLETNLETPSLLDDGLDVSTLEDENIDADVIKDLVNKIYQDQPQRQIRSFLIARNNKLVLESYYNGWHGNRKQDIRSATKSFTSSLVGIAIDQQILQNENQRIMDFFTEYSEFQNTDQRKSDMTIEDFLRMRTGMSCNDDIPSSPGNEENMYDTNDWIKFVLDLPMVREPGENFSYCTGAPVTLGAVISNASSIEIPEFSDVYLFSKLGITDYTWEFMPTGRADTGGHLHMRPRDMLKFGLLFLNSGNWNGEQVISESWVAKSTEMTGLARSYEYAYLWWGVSLAINGEEINAFFASGNGGQLIFVIPELDTVLVFTGGNYNTDHLTPLLNIIENTIIPSFQ